MKSRTIAATAKKAAVKTAAKPATKAAAKRPATRTPARSARNTPVAASADGIKQINLALQGGGAHGAFGWGVMDKFLEDGRIEIEGLSGTSAGSMNAVVYAYGKLKGNDGAREALHDFWKAISDAGQKFAMPRMPWDMGIKENPMQDMMKSMMSVFSPYQLNPMNYNPLREVLEQQVDFEKLERSQGTKLFQSTQRSC